MDVLDATSLEPNVTIDGIDGVHRLGIWKQSNSKPRTNLAKLVTYRVKQHVFNAKKEPRNISLPPKVH